MLRRLYPGTGKTLQLKKIDEMNEWMNYEWMTKHKQTSVSSETEIGILTCWIETKQENKKQRSKHGECCFASYVQIISYWIHKAIINIRLLIWKYGLVSCIIVLPWLPMSRWHVSVQINIIPMDSNTGMYSKLEHIIC